MKNLRMKSARYWVKVLMNYLEMNDVHYSVIAVKFFDRDLLYGLFVLDTGKTHLNV